MGLEKLDILAFAPHPDDVELFCSGTLIKMKKKGYEIGVCDLTRGEMSTRGTPEIRAKEVQNSSKIMDVAMRINLEIPDCLIENNRENRFKVIEVIREYLPKVIFIPYWEDRHPDHIQASKLITEASFYAGLKAIETNFSAYRPQKNVYYFQHSIPVTPSFVVDISDVFDQKIQAIQAYETQFYNPDHKPNEAEIYISNKTFFDGIRGRASYFGSKIGCHYGEPFFVKEVMGLDDPVAFFQVNK